MFLVCLCLFGDVRTRNAFDLGLDTVVRVLMVSFYLVLNQCFEVKKKFRSLLEDTPGALHLGLLSLFLITS